MTDHILQPEEHANENIPVSSADQQPSRPFDIVPLPSKGLLYKDGPLAGKEALEVYYLTAKEEDILTAPNLLRSGKVMDVLLKAVMVDRKIDVSQLLLGDRNAILVWLRSTGYGADYPVALQCEHCNRKFEYTFDLGALDVRFLECEPDDEGLFGLDLPASKKFVRLKFLTGADDEELDKMIRMRAKKVGGTGNPMTVRLFKIVADVEGLDDNEKRRFLETLPAQDSRTIRKFIFNNEPTVLMQQDAECTECGEENAEVVIPITPRFFWPDS
jgi:hypothetical protein